MVQPQHTTINMSTFLTVLFTVKKNKHPGKLGLHETFVHVFLFKHAFYIDRFSSTYHYLLRPN